MRFQSVALEKNFILLLLLLNEGGEENSIYHAFAAPFKE